MRTSVIASTFFFLILFAIPAGAHAANATFFGPIVPAECHCDNQTDPDGKPITTAPDYGCVLQTLQNTINFAVSMGIILFVLFLVYAGARLVLSGGSPSAREQARTRLTNVIVGMVVLLCSWLIVDFVMKTVYDQNVQFGPWNAILAGKSDGTDRCIVAKTPESLTTGTLSILTGTLPGTGTGEAANTASGDENAVRKQFSAAGISVNKGSCPYNTPFQNVSNGCTTVGGLQQNTIQQVIQLKSVCGSVEVTGGNELGHAEGGESHTTGYKVDLATNIDSCIYGGHGGYFARNGSRGSDAQYKDKCGNSYVRESNPAHWDITVHSVCVP